MQSPDQIKREIAGIEDRVQKIVAEISKKEKELQKQTKHHSELLIRHLDKKIKPRCIETAHRLAKTAHSSTIGTTVILQIDMNLSLADRW